MQLEVKLEELRKHRLFVATPMYGGSNHGMYMKACLDLQSVCMNYGIENKFSFIFNESLITRARNYLVDEFLRSDCTHLLFIDADIHFDPRDVIAMMAIDKDVIGGPYPKKSIKWPTIKQALVKNPALDVGELEKLSGDFVFNPAPGTETIKIDEPIEVLELGTGFMMIKRHVFDTFREAYPELKYKPDHVGQTNFDGSRYIHAYFDTVIDSKTANFKNEMAEYLKKNPTATVRDISNFMSTEEGVTSRYYSDRYLSEDYMFCQWWRNIGGKIWICPWFRTHHIGTYAFTGDMPAIAAHVGSL